MKNIIHLTVKRQKKLYKIFSVFASFSLLFQSFLPYSLALIPLSSPQAVRAEEITEPTELPTEPAVELPPSPPVEATTELSVEPTITPTFDSTIETKIDFDTDFLAESITETPASNVEITPVEPPLGVITTENPVEEPAVIPDSDTDLSTAEELTESADIRTNSKTTETVKVCLSSEQIINTTNEDWNITGGDNIAETKEAVKLGVVYTFPLENKVSVTFKCLPEDENLRTLLKIQKIAVSELNLPEDVKPATEYAYDITTGMENGTFEYDVTLPKPANQTAEVFYIEKSIEEIKNFNVAENDLIEVSSSDLELELGSELVKVVGIDHFTLFIPALPIMICPFDCQAYNSASGSCVGAPSSGCDPQEIGRRICTGNTSSCIAYNGPIVECHTATDWIQGYCQERLRSSCSGDWANGSCPPPPDTDDDGVADPYDNCPLVANSAQEDDDGDFWGNVCDNCPVDYNDDQLDTDGDGIGDLCDTNEPTKYLVINEIDYDQSGTDDAEFIEIKNNSSNSVNLDDYEVKLINGSVVSVYETIDLPDVSLADGDYFVICADNTNTPNCDLDISPDTNLIENGGPDAVALYKREAVANILIDTVSYEGDVPGYTETEGVAENDGSAGDVGLSRFPDGTDTDNNKEDFVLSCITPGFANTENSEHCDKITICHATSSNSNPYVTLELPYQAVYGPGGHFNENSTTQAGHEEDYMGACTCEDEPTNPDCVPNLTPTPTATPVLSSCGNGIVEDGEECDYGDLNGYACSQCQWNNTCSLEMLTNGSFESPAVTHNSKWDIFDNDQVGGWTAQWYGGSATYQGQDRPEPKIELHAGVNGWGSADDQHVELDSDWFGPDSNISGEPASITLYQDIPTIIGFEYTLEYNYAPRPDYANNQVVVKINGDTELYNWDSGNLSGNGSLAWQTGNYTFLADSTLTRISFTETGPADSLGMFLNDVSVECLGQDKPLYACGTTVFGINNNSDVSWVDPVSGEIHQFSTAGFGSSASADNPLKERTYYIERLDSGGDTLAYFDHSDSTNHDVGDLNVDSFFTKLAFREDGVLYGLTDNHHLYRINYTTPQANHIGLISGISSGGDIVFDYNNDLYLIGTNGDFYRVNVNTLAKTKIADTGISDVSGLALANGQFYVATRGSDGTYSDVYQMDYDGNTTLLSEDQILVNDLSSCPASQSAQTGGIRVCKFNDLDGDGTWIGDNEPLLAGWNFKVGDREWQATEENGCFQIDGLTAGSYQIEEQTQQGWTVTTPNPYQADVRGNMLTIIHFGNHYDGYCGDGIINGEEECDGIDEVTGGVNFCTSTCQLIPLYDGSHACPANTTPVKLTENPLVLSSTNNSSIQYSFEAGKNYLLEASGTYSYNKRSAGNLADPAYGTRDNWGTTRNDIGIWGTNRGVTSIIGNLGLGMGVIEWDDDTVVNNSHVYQKAFSPDSAVTADFVISDWYGNWYGSDYDNQSGMIDNEGDLQLDIYECRENEDISGVKWEDKNGNGYRNPADNGLSGWTINLWYGTDMIDPVLPADLTVVTGADGSYKFEDLPLGKYTVCEEDRAGWMQTLPVGGTCYYLTLGGNDKPADNIDFGNFKLGMIQGLKYNDLNANGDFDQFEKNEAGNPNRLDGWRIYLYDESWNLLSSMLTGDDTTAAGNVDKGQYRFTALEKGKYYVCEEDRSSDWLQTEPITLVQDPNTGLNCFTANIDRSGRERIGLQFGNVELGSIHGYKWNDLNQNGRRDCLNAGLEAGGDSLAVAQMTCELEPLLSGWEVFIDENDNNSWDEGETKMNTSDDPGHFGWYWFENLLPGDYRVCETVQSGWEQTYPFETQCHTVTLPDTNPGLMAVSANAVIGAEYNFGNFQYGRVGGYKFNDANKNGIWDQGEDPLNDWEICLSKEEQELRVFVFEVAQIDEQQEPEETNCVLTGSNDWVDGYYEFNNLAYGSYAVAETLQTDWEQTYPVGPNTHSVLVESGTDSTNNNFGNYTEPDLVIAKTNTAKDNAQILDVNDIVTFTITVVNNGPGKAYDVRVVDQQPIGDYFEYQTGSGHLTCTDGTDTNLSATGSNPYTWVLGDMDDDEECVLTYDIKILNTNIAGEHHNLAYALGLGGDGATHYSNVVIDPFDVGYKRDLSKDVGGTVLGISTGAVLGAATGSKTGWAISAILAILFGIFLKIMPRKNMRKILKSLLPIVIAGLFFSQMSMTVLAVDNTAPAVAIVQLPEYLNKRDFEISYTALDAGEAGLRDVVVDYHKEGNGWSNIGTYTDGAHKINVGSKVDSEGKWYFRATACDNNNNCASSETNTTVDQSGPPAPENFSKEKTGVQSYKLKWHNPNSDDIYQVYIYRSDKRDFTADNGTEVSRVNVTKNTDSEWTDWVVPDASKIYYYVIRSVDRAGNGSDLVGDLNIVTVNEQGDPITEGETVAGQEAVVGGGTDGTIGGTTGGGRILGEESEATDEAGQTILDTTMTDETAEDQAPAKTKSWLWVLGGGALLAAAGYWFFKGEKK